MDWQPCTFWSERSERNWHVNLTWEQIWQEAIRRCFSEDGYDEINDAVFHPAAITPLSRKLEFDLDQFF
jgi:hypothetical protein